MLSLVLVGLLGASADPLDVTGVWFTQNRDSQVEIRRTGDAGLEGAIIWYVGHDEEAVFDTRNPDPGKRDQEILGLEILRGFEPGDDRWRQGEIYDPTSGKSYRSAVYRKDEDTLAVQGCVGFICVTQEWERVPEDSVRRVERPPVTRSGGDAAASSMDR